MLQGIDRSSTWLSTNPCTIFVDMDHEGVAVMQRDDLLIHGNSHR